MSAPELSTVVVSWASRQDVVRLAERFPRDPRHELIVVDNGSELGAAKLGSQVRLVTPGTNLGFAAGANRGAREARGANLLFLNPDIDLIDPIAPIAPIDSIAPTGNAYDAVLDGLARRSDADGLVPKLLDADGTPQTRWQLRPLPGPATLVASALGWPLPRGPEREPAAGTAVEQPAAAALALRRRCFDEIGGFDERFFPAWFEDVDLAARLAARGRKLLYWPAAAFVHRGGAAVDALGYRRFLLCYERNLALYLRIHHGRDCERLFRALLPIGAALRIALLPLSRPARAESRRVAAGAFLAVGRGAIGGWHEGGKTS